MFLTHRPATANDLAQVVTFPQNRDELFFCFPRAAHKAVSNAIRDGKLTPLPCQVCGIQEVEAHHPDYSRPLDVVWLCRHHHSQIHKES